MNGKGKGRQMTALVNTTVCSGKHTKEVHKNGVGRTKHSNEFIKFFPKSILGRHLGSVINKIEPIIHI